MLSKQCTGRSLAVHEYLIPWPEELLRSWPELFGCGQLSLIRRLINPRTGSRSPHYCIRQEIPIDFIFYSLLKGKIAAMCRKFDRITQNEPHKNSR